MATKPLSLATLQGYMDASPFIRSTGMRVVEANAEAEPSAKREAREEPSAKREAREEPSAKREAREEPSAKREAREEPSAKREAREEPSAKREAREEPSAKREARGPTLVVTMPLKPEFERAAGSGQFHGGPIAALIDTAGCFALVMTLGHGVPTINFRTDYLRPAVNTSLRAEARVRRAGRTVGVVDVDVFDESHKLVAVGRGTFGSQPG